MGSPTGAKLTGGAASPADLANARRIEQARAGGGDLVKAAAAKWQAGLGGLLGVVIGGWAFGFGKEIRAISSPWAAAITVGLGVAVLLSFYALWMSLRASGGIPRPHRTKGFDVRAFDHAEATSSAASLSAAIWWSIPAIVLHLVVVSAVWFAPRDAAPSHVRIVQLGGSELCGEVSAVIGDVVFVNPVDSEPIKVALAEVQSFESSVDCG